MVARPLAAEWMKLAGKYVVGNHRLQWMPRAILLAPVMGRTLKSRP